MDSQHKSLFIVNPIIDELLMQVVSERLESEDSDESGDSEDDESPEVRERNARVAAIQAEFRELFPNFQQELNEIKDSLKPKKKSANKKHKTNDIVNEGDKRITRSSGLSMGLRIDHSI